MGVQRKILWGFGIVSIVAIVYSQRPGPKTAGLTKAVDTRKTLLQPSSFSDTADSSTATQTNYLPKPTAGVSAESRPSEAAEMNEVAEIEQNPKPTEARLDDATLTDEARETRLRELLAMAGSDVSEAMEIHTISCENSSCKIEAESRTDDLGFFQESMVTFLQENPGMGKNFEINTDPQNLRLATFIISKTE